MIIFDLDGTLSLVGDRRKYINRPVGLKDWNSFLWAAGEDKPNMPIAKIFWAMKEKYRVKIVTARMENQRDMTSNWLKDNGLYPGTENLHMRALGDHRPDTVVKPELIAPFIHKIEMLFEDRATLTEMWRSLGLTCLQVAPGDF